MQTGRVGHGLHAIGMHLSQNRAVCGATRSKHMEGAASTFAMANHDPVAFEAAASAVGFLGFGFYPRSTFMHVDLGPARDWGTRFRGLLTGIATRPWMPAALRYGAILLAVLLFVLSLRRFGERTGRLAERLETTEKANDVQGRMPDAGCRMPEARRPRSRHELAERLRDGQF